MATKKAAKIAKKPAKKAVKTAAKKAVKKTAKKSQPKLEVLEPVLGGAPEADVSAPVPTTGITDPIGDTADREVRISLAEEVPVEAAADARANSVSSEAQEDEDGSEETTAAPRPPAKLDRLQKILSQAGVASRRKAEEMIEQGRVQVNGQVITVLGAKADANRDHIRVDGKLLHGAERLRYFVLNKPKGYVTTVKDPEGRPTVMQFFEKMRERLYPVGRLDYMSEGLLLVTNDGELANKLTKAGSGVQKVYLVKVAGQPTEEELNLLRGGVSIERGKPGSPQVRTSPAQIRQVRQGDNPWYEVVLIEGRNRELRKMFQAVGHFVEKIRRVGYGPLVLDQEPGKMRELEPEELAALRLASEGKLRTPKAKEVRRRNLADAQLPTVRPRPSQPQSHSRSGKPFESRRPDETRSFDRGAAGAGRRGEFRPRPSFGPASSQDKPFRPARPAWEKPGRERSAGEKPAWKKDERSPRPPARFTPGASGDRRPAAGKPYGDRPPANRNFGARPGGRPFAGKSNAGKPSFGKPSFGKPGFSKPNWTKPGSDRPPFKQPAAPRRETPADDFVPFKPGQLRIDPIEPDRQETRGPRTFSKPPARTGGGKPAFDRSRTGKPGFAKPKPESARPGFEKGGFDKSGPARPRVERPRFENPGPGRSKFDRAGSGSSRPPRGESGLARPFTTSSGKPRAGGARPSSKPFKPGRSSRPGPGSFSKSGGKGSGFKSTGFKSKSGGAKRSGPRPGNKKRG